MRAGNTFMSDTMFNNDFDEFKSPRITLWRMTRAEIEHENTLIHYRTTWLLSSQAFLTAAFGLILTGWMKNELQQDSHNLAPWLLLIIAAYASYLCLCFHDALDRAHRQLKRLQKHYAETLPNLPPSLVPVPPLQYMDVMPPLRFGRADSIAVASLIVWVGLLVSSAFLLSVQGLVFVAGVFAVVALVIVVGWVSYKAGINKRNEVTDTEHNDLHSAYPGRHYSNPNRRDAAL